MKAIGGAGGRGGREVWAIAIPEIELDGRTDTLMKKGREGEYGPNSPSS